MSNPYTESSLTTTGSAHPYTLYAITTHPDSTPHRDAIQHLCPYTGSNLTGRHSPRVSLGIPCLLPVPTTPPLWVGHGSGSNSNNNKSRKDDWVFLLSSSNHHNNGGVGNSSTRWRVRPPEPLTCTPQSMAISGRYAVLSSQSGNCFLHQWTDTDNLMRVWKAHYRAVTCCVFDGTGATLFTAGEDGVVNAWCLLDLLGGGAGRVFPCCTWSEHVLPVTWVHVCEGGGGGGGVRLISCSLDRRVVVMEMGGGRSQLDGGCVEARVLARICLPSGLHCVISDSLDARLYGAGADGNVYCIDMDAYAIHETLDGCGTVVRVDRPGRDAVGADWDSIMSGRHVVQEKGWRETSTDQRKYVSELKGHAKAVLSLALMDPSDLASTSPGPRTATLLASGSEDGTVRIWDMRTRSCVRVLRPWAPSSEGISLHSAASSTTSPPVTGLISIPTSTSMRSNGALAMGSLVGSHAGRHSGQPLDVSSIFKPLKRFVRGSSVAQDKVGADAETQSEDCCLLLRPRRGTSFSWEDRPILDSHSFMRCKKART